MKKYEKPTLEIESLFSNKPVAAEVDSLVSGTDPDEGWSSWWEPEY